MLIDGKRSPRRISCSPTSVCSSTVVPSSTQLCNADSTSATPTLAACLGLAFISPSIARKATSMCTELAAALAVPRTRISPATCVLGKDLIIILGRSSDSFNPFSKICRQLLLCRVALGKSFLQYSAMKMAHAPPGHHSVVGRPSAGGLHFAEYVVYRGEQVNSIQSLRVL